jgi:hypothetical protein
MSRNEREIRRAREGERMLQFLCTISRSLVDVGDKLDDQTTLIQQQVDLLRRLIQERVI